MRRSLGKHVVLLCFVLIKTSTVTIHSWVDQRSLSTNLQWSLCSYRRSDRNSYIAKKKSSCLHSDSILATEMLKLASSSDCTVAGFSYDATHNPTLWGMACLPIALNLPLDGNHPNFLQQCVMTPMRAQLLACKGGNCGHIKTSFSKADSYSSFLISLQIWLHNLFIYSSPLFHKCFFLFQKQMAISLPPLHYYEVLCKQMDNFMSFP